MYSSRIELSKWEEKMIRQGHIEYVRRESLVESPAPKPRASSTKDKNTSSRKE